MSLRALLVDALPVLGSLALAATPFAFLPFVEAAILSGSACIAAATGLVVAFVWPSALR